MTDDPMETVIADPSWVQWLFWGGFPALGAGAGFLLVRILGWLLELPWVPMQGPLRLLDSLGEPLTSIVAALIGAGAGMALAVSAASEQLSVSVSGHRVTLTRAGATTELARSQVHGVFRDGKQLVLLGPAGEELAREASDLPETPLREAFSRHGYRWHAEGDPYWDDYRRWVEGAPGLPAGAAALLRAREAALAKQDRTDAAQLRDELARLGIVVRDEETRQFWRPHRSLDR